MVAVRDDVDVNKLLPGLSHLWCAAEGVDRVKAADVCSSGDATPDCLVLPSSTSLVYSPIAGSSSRRSSMASAKVLTAGDVVVDMLWEVQQDSPRCLVSSFTIHCHTAARAWVLLQLRLAL